MAIGRPRKQTADYFPHYVTDSRTKFILEDNWGNDGYAFWFKLLELLCKSDGHCYDCSATANHRYLLAFTRVQDDTADAIMATLVELGKIDKELWEEKRIIWCQTLVDNLASLYSKRTVALPRKPFSQDNPQPTEQTDLPPTEQPKPEEEKKAAKAIAGQAKKPRKKKETPEKKKYAEFVSMTEEEYGKLLQQHGAEKTVRMIEILDNYKGSKGKKYASDYRAILNWVIERVEEEYAKKGSGYGEFNANRQNNSSSGGFKPSGGFKGE